MTQWIRPPSYNSRWPRYRAAGLYKTDSSIGRIGRHIQRDANDLADQWERRHSDDIGDDAGFVYDRAAPPCGSIASGSATGLGRPVSLGSGNLRASKFLSGLAELARSRAGVAMSMMGQSETRQGGPWIPETFMLTAGSLDRANRLSGKIIIRPTVLLERFNDSQLYTMAEAVQTFITPRAGGRCQRID